MDQSNSPEKGKKKAKEDNDKADQMTSPQPIHPISYQPKYMTVGSGIQPSHATALMEQLERDSGYGSMVGDNQQIGGEMRSWEDQLLVDRPTPAHTPQINGQPAHMSDTEKRALAGHIHQLYYNQNRVALAKAIGQTVELLKQLQDMNAQWPAHYPSVQRSENETRTSRPSLAQTQSTRDASELPHDLASKKLGRPGRLRRFGTSIGEDSSSAESSQQVQHTATSEPRLITPQIAQEFSILKLDLKVGALSQTELVHSLEKKSIASLLDGKIGQSVRHLLALRDRIEDTSSKVLVTGDLNAGKSTFCNALLRRKILPEDQQPCTSIFCEVLDAKENGGLEEVHAVHKEATYDRNDESTYDVFALHELEKIVVDNDRYMQCKVYVKDVRSIDQSLLNNGVVDIALIDAPGLNSDSVKTTAVFARQEEIDVVVFVVSAANHFTLSAKEFIWQAAHEKAYIFMVVNGFDNIRDKERCQKLILEQLGHLSPQTFKEAKELVHFVSSNAVPVQPALPSNGGGGDGGGGSGPSPPDDDDNDDSSKGKGKDKEKIQDFEMLESALRRFVLEKRARSKLAPAKTYLMNCLGDMNVLATVNRDVASSELDRVSKELSEIEPEYEERTKQRGLISEQLEKDMDSTATDVYNHTRSTLSSTIANVGSGDLGVEYPGLLSAFQYAEDLRIAMLDQISAAVTQCEAYGRSQTVKSVDMVKSLGLLHVGDTYENLTFQADRMFQRRRDALVRTVDTDVELWDFFDVAGLWERQEKTLGTGLALTVVGTVGSRAVGGIGWVDGAFGAAKVIGSRSLRRLFVPGVVAAAMVAVAYILSTIPQTLPPRLASKLSATLSQMDYTHSNSARIASEVRRVLRFPAQRLSGDLQSGVEELRKKKEDVTKIKKESEVARKYFGNLVRDSSETRRRVSAIDLESPIPGAAAAYVS
ncbi:mitofusin [Exophiala aquamarina CBS 119918]|uniref:Mitofusin n=1 Tax=Exophiala aquamarina CBS 119918 TaxID=1182545 RepID=A0A072P1B6_9EURO|nr:mitofusin [Exophiala aquamarina CBS 119918]KEF53467.1 mitofusin [Exophiala aquamarina CBS 119918]